MDISSYFHHFIKHIRPTGKQLAKKQLLFTTLKTQLRELVESEGSYHLENIFLAGSTAKHTDLKDSSDIDLGVYYRSQGRTEQELSRLLQYTHECLRRIYPPEKLAQDIHKGKNAINVTLRTRKTKADFVPIVRDAYLEQRNGGYIPREDKWRYTSITHHIHFVHSRTARSKRVSGSVKFNHLVRLMKWWNRQLPERLQQCSYFYELITAEALRKDNVKETYQSSLCQIFQFLSEHAFSQPIFFNNCDAQTARCLHPHDLVIVLDAVNPQINVANKWNKDIKREYLENVRKTYALIKQAQAYEQAEKNDAALNCWCKIFENDFQQ
jgi:hypothetical protein